MREADEIRKVAQTTPRALTKAVILAAGRGTRMREERADVVLEPEQSIMADLGLKTMIPFAGRPFLDYVLSALADAGYEQACLVVNPQDEVIRGHYTRATSPTRISVTFAIQQMSRGTADAVLSAENFAAADSFLMINGDNYYPVSSLAALRTLGGPGLIGFDRELLQKGSNITMDRLTKYAIGFVRSDGSLERIIEKPEPEIAAASAGSTVISMNCWRFSSDIFAACRAISPSARQELELADAVQYAIDTLHARFRVVRSDAAVLDLTNRTDIVNVGARLHGLHVAL